MSDTSYSLHLRTVPQVVRPEIQAVVKDSLMLAVVALAEIVSIATLGNFSQLNDWVDQHGCLAKLPQNIFLITGTTVNPTFRENLYEGRNYRKVVKDFGSSPSIDKIIDEEVNSRLEAFVFAFRCSYSAIYDFSIGMIKSIQAASEWFVNEELNKEAISYLGGLRGLQVAAWGVRNVVAITPSWAQNT